MVWTRTWFFPASWPRSPAFLPQCALWNTFWQYSDHSCSSCNPPSVFDCISPAESSAVFSTIVPNLPAHSFVAPSPSRFLLVWSAFPRTVLSAPSGLLPKCAPALCRTCPPGTLIREYARSQKPNWLWVSQSHVETSHSACREACNALGMASHDPTPQPSCIPLWHLLNFFVTFFDTHLLVLHSALSPSIKHALSVSIVDIHGNDSCGFGILFCSCGDTRPLNARRSAAPLHAHTVDNGCGFPTAWPRSLSNNKWFFHVYALHERPSRTGTLVPDLFSRTDYFCLSICAPCRMV